LAINLKDLYDTYYGDTSYLTPVKCNTPFEYYDNDPEFVRDAKSVARFVAQRLGTGLGLAQLNISDLTVYAAFEEAVTTYGNMVYQYKIRDQYLSMEGAESSPFNNATVTYVNSIDVSSPITWSSARLATLTDIDNNPTYTQAVNAGSVYVISASLSNFILPNLDYVKSFTLASEYVSGSTTYDLSQYVYNKLNKVSGSYLYFFTTSPQIASGSALFGTGSIPTVYIQDILDPEFNNKLVSDNLATLTTTIAENYASEAGVGGNYTVYSGTLPMKRGVQDYDLNTWAADSASLNAGDRIEIRRIFYEEPPAIVRYFDPYAGTGTGIQSLLETFGFGQFSPGINFLLMPIYFDIQKIQAIEFNDQIRKAAYSFNLVNNKLKIFPIPTEDKNLFFEYVKISEKFNPIKDNRNNIVTDIMNVPYRNPIYSRINTVGRTWIFKYTLALCREIEAHIRLEFSTVNVQGVGALQGSDLIQDARTEKEQLLTELKEMLNEVSRKAQLERQQQEAMFARDTLTQIPLPIYIF